MMICASFEKKDFRLPGEEGEPGSDDTAGCTTAYLRSRWIKDRM
jgi:hypothetical protein